MKLLLAHGWGFDRHFWDPMREHLAGHDLVTDDRGYFGAPSAPAIEGPCLAVTHSFGTMRVLAAPPRNLVGIVAINGFARFAARDGLPGVRVRVIERMEQRLGEDPGAVLHDFRKACGGGDMPWPDRLAIAPLSADLTRLRTEQAPHPTVPVLSLQGRHDPLLPEALRADAFAGAQTLHHEHDAGHLLPIEHPALCARTICEFWTALQP